MTRKIQTYGDLMIALSLLTEEQLKQPVVFWGVAASGRIDSIEVLEVDHYHGLNDEGAYPDTFIDPADIDKHQLAYPKDTVLLSVLDPDFN